ncbi:hypothetical protein [Kribbella sp. DT2]|uniref:hypothetical protein n=1 Tax=Kribbella sp. DT2 TaxID=3393427 RepID=UPI003CF7F438
MVGRRLGVRRGRRGGSDAGPDGVAGAAVQADDAVEGVAPAFGGVFRLDRSPGRPRPDRRRSGRLAAPERFEFNRKAGGPASPTAANRQPGGEIWAQNDNAVSYSWSNGTPTANQPATRACGIFFANGPSVTRLFELSLGAGESAKISAQLNRKTDASGNVTLADASADSSAQQDQLRLAYLLLRAAYDDAVASAAGAEYTSVTNPGLTSSFVSEYAKDGLKVKVENFADLVVVAGNRFEVAYSRMTVTTTTATTTRLPRVSSLLTPLNAAAEPGVEPNETGTMVDKTMSGSGTGRRSGWTATRSPTTRGSARDDHLAPRDVEREADGIPGLDQMRDKASICSWNSHRAAVVAA